MSESIASVANRDRARNSAEHQRGAMAHDGGALRSSERRSRHTAAQRIRRSRGQNCCRCERSRRARQCSKRRGAVRGSCRPEPDQTMKLQLSALRQMSLDDLRTHWRFHCKGDVPAHGSRDLLVRAIIYQQESATSGAALRKAQRRLAATTNGPLPPLARISHPALCSYASGTTCLTPSR